MDSHSFFQRIFRTQGSNLGLLHYRQTLFSLSHQGSPYYPYFVEKLNLRIILLRFFKKIFYPSTQREYWSQSQIGGEILWTVDGWKFTAHFNFLTASSETGIVLGISQCCLRSPYLTVRQQFPFSTDELWNWESLLFQRQAVNYGAEWRFYFHSNWHLSWCSTDSKKSLSSLVNCSTTVNFSTDDLYLYSFSLDVSMWSVLLRHLGSLQQPWDA